MSGIPGLLTGIAPAPTGHPGSKRRFFRLPVVTDTQGNRRVIWPKRKRRGRDARPMAAEAREAGYRRQKPKRASLTAAQNRRIRSKRNRSLREAT